MKFCKLQTGWMLVGSLMLLAAFSTTQSARADKSVAPRRVEPARVTIPVEVKYADLAGEGDGVKAKLVLPARLRELREGKKVGSSDLLQSKQRSMVAAIALSLAAVSVVFVLRGKKWTGATKGAVLGIAVLLGVFGVAQADISVGPPPVKRSQPPPVLRPKAADKSMIVIEYSADVEDAVLTIAK